MYDDGPLLMTTHMVPEINWWCDLVTIGRGWTPGTPHLRLEGAELDLLVETIVACTTNHPRKIPPMARDKL